MNTIRVTHRVPPFFSLPTIEFKIWVVSLDNGKNDVTLNVGWNKS